MEIFKLFESTLVNVQPGHISTKDLRRDQLSAKYDEATKTLEILIKSKEDEISYRRDLVEMLEKSKTVYDNKLSLAKQAYQLAKSKAPESLDLRIPTSVSVSGGKKSEDNQNASISHPNISTTPTTTPPGTANDPIGISSTASTQQQQSSQMTLSDSDLDLPLSTQSMENRTSLDRRLSEFLKTFPNLSQAGLAQQANNNEIKPLPGYYTQQPPPPPAQITTTAPPMMAMLRFPPPPLIPPPPHHHHPPPHPHHQISLAGLENHEGPTDMDLSDYDEPMNNGGTSSSSTPNVQVLPMIASAMQQGAGGNKQLRAEVQATYLAGPPHQQQYNSPSTIQYAPRLNALPFDPSIMDSRLRESPASSSGSGTRDKHSSSSHGVERGGSHRHSGGSGSSSGSVKHGSDKNKYPPSSSSSHSSGRSSKRR